VIFYRNIYNVNWVKLVKMLTPIVLRQNPLTCFIKAFTHPFIILHNDFISYSNRVNYHLQITPQVCYLEKALNDKYDLVHRRIFITDAPEYLPIILFRKSENKKLLIKRKTEGNPQVLYTKPETALFGVDFIVNIPVGIVFDANELKAFLQVYKLATKTFKIKIF
jgi:hypothetical protein